MATCLIDLCGEKGVEGFHLLQPLFYHLKTTGRFSCVAAGIENISREAISHISGENTPERLIIFVEPEKGTGVLGQSLFVKLAKIKEKLLCRTDVKPENCVVIVLDTVEREEYTGRPVKSEKVATWELDFSGWLRESREDLPFVFSGRDYETLSMAWGATFVPNASLYSNRAKEELAAADKEELAGRIDRLRECCEKLKKEKLEKIHAYQEDYGAGSYVEELETKIQDSFEVFYGKLSELDQQDIGDGYGQFRPEDVLRHCVQIIWGVRGQSEDMSLLWLQMPQDPSLRQRRIVELAMLTLAVAEGRLEECLRQNVPRLHNVTVKLNHEVFGLQIGHHVGALKAEADRLQGILSLVKLAGEIPTFQDTEFPPMGELKQFSPASSSFGFFSATGDYAIFEKWAKSQIDGLDKRRGQAIEILNTCSDEQHQGLLQKPDMRYYNDIESERNTRLRKLESENSPVEATHIPDNRKELEGKLEVYRNEFLKLSEVRPTVRPAVISMVAGLGIFALPYMSGITPIPPGETVVFRMALPGVTLLVGICCMVALLVRYRRRLLSLVSRFRTDVMTAFGFLKTALTASHGVLNKRYEISMARRNFELADRVFQREAHGREFLRHHRDTLSKHAEKAKKLLEPFGIRCIEPPDARYDGQVELLETPAYRNCVYWPFGEQATRTMSCNVKDHPNFMPLEQPSLGTIELHKCRWQQH